ncbi:MAG: hypothetical protein NZ805_00155 [Armatimonadetes bacterium]|nr:hypothetical protein [Armatimonadota bacterium]MDW8026929.1 hypothetical protein [Armatimonadota bacterium]
MKANNLVLAIGLMAAFTSSIFGQTESFAPKDLTVRPNMANSTSLSVSLPFSKSLSLSLFRDYSPPPKRSFQQPKFLVGRTVVGGSSQLDVGEFQFRSTLLRSGAVIPRAFPEDPSDTSNPLTLFAPPSPAMRFRSPSAFRNDWERSSFIVWQGEFFHQSIGYQSRNGDFKAALHYAEADPKFQPATSDFAQKLAAETGLQMPINAFAGVSVKQGEAQWKMDNKTTVQAFVNTTTGQKGGVAETRAFSIGNSHLTFQWDKVRAEDMDKIPAPAGASQQQVIQRALTLQQSQSNRQAPLQVGNWQLWRNLKQEGLQAGYQNKGVQLAFERREISGTGGAIERSNTSVILGKEQFVWQRQREDVAKGTNPEGLKALGLQSLIPRIGWQSSREKLAIKFSAKDGFSREEFRLSNGSTEIERNSLQISLLSGSLTFRERSENTARVDPNFLKAIGLEKDLPKIGWAYRDRELKWQFNPKDRLTVNSYRYESNTTVLERAETHLTLLSGQLQWEERREQLSSGVDPNFLKAIGWEGVSPRLGWSSLWQKLTWQLTPKERLMFSRSKHESGGTSVERKNYAISIANGKFGWERTEDEATPTLNSEQLKVLGLNELTSRIGWRERQDRFTWQITPNMNLVHKQSSAEALPDAPQPFREKQSHETVLTINADPKRRTPPMTIAFGGWRLQPKDPNKQPVTERHLRWDTAQQLPLLGGIQIVMQRHFTETKQGETERDTRFARTVIQTPDKKPIAFFVDRSVYEETGKEQRETINARLTTRLSADWQLTTQLNKQPQGNGSIETRQHILAYQPRPNLSMTTQFVRTEMTNGERQQTDLTIKIGDEKKGNQQWQISRFEVDTKANTDVKGWRFSWNLAVPNRLNLKAQLGRVSREDNRNSGEEKLTVQVLNSKKEGLTWQFGYWRMSLLDPAIQQETVKQLAQSAQASSQPVAQAGTPPLIVINSRADSYRTVWFVASKPDLHIGAQLGQAEGSDKEASDHKVYIELPATKSRPIALRFSYWKVEQWDGKEREIPVWRLSIPFGKGKLVWGAATFRDQNGELPMREFAMILPIDKNGSQFVITNLTNMPQGWSQQWQQQDWLKFTGGLALSPQLPFVRQQLAPYKLHRANLTLSLNKEWKLVGLWEEQIGVPQMPITHDWRLALEWTPSKTIQWRFEWAKLKNDTPKPVRTDLFGVSYNYKLSDARYITFSVRWLENPLFTRPNFRNDRWLATMSLSQQW